MMRLLAMAGVGVLLTGCGPETPQERAASECVDGNTMAGIMVQDAVRSRLKAPSSAQFPVATAKVVQVKPCEFLVAGPLDAQNSFGAMIRNTYMATIRYDPDDDTWQVLSAEVLE